jgi:hypothetical protein
MSKHNVNDQEYFAEIPGTLYTVQGNTYHIDRKGVEHVAPGLLDKVSLSQLLYDSDALVQAPAYVMYYTLLGSLWISVEWGLIASALTFLLAYGLWPWFSLGSLPSLFRFISREQVTFSVSALLLPLHGMYGTEAAMWIGLLGFIVLRVWLMFSRNRRMNINPSQNDRILHMIIDRYALRFGLPSLRTAAMEQKLNFYLRYRRTSKGQPNRNSKQK